jgi:plasmid stabilization system protein ParE
MALPVIWTVNAIEDYKLVIDYLLLEWPLPVAKKFVETIEKRIEVLSDFPNIGIASLKDPSIRSIILTKHNKLYYRVYSDKIEILNIFDTRQDPEKNLFG